MSTTKEARRDAEEYARAAMAHGEGAGVRRRLIAATVETKAARDEKYARAFKAEIAEQDMAEHARKARQENKRREVNGVVSRNVRGILTADVKKVDNSVLLLLAGAYVAHQTGYDRKLWNDAKNFGRKVKSKLSGETYAPVHNIRNHR